jgi:hypothetical protein
LPERSKVLSFQGGAGGAKLYPDVRTQLGTSGLAFFHQINAYYFSLLLLKVDITNNCWRRRFAK